MTTTTVWHYDELLKGILGAWKRLFGENGYSGTRIKAGRASAHTAFTGTYSVFPAPLCEAVLLRYGGPEGGLVLDAFAGGPPRGAVAALMGYRYLGYEIRQAQIDENMQAVANLGISTGVEYRCSDGTVLAGCDDQSVDFAFTCPPYYRLESYSDLPEDLSNMPSYEAFHEAMLRCAHAHRRVMKPGAFVCIVAAPFRLMNRAGVNELVDLPGHLITAFRAAGFYYWQNVIISRNFGSAVVRTANAWRGKKLVPRHEELLVFRTPEEDV